MKPLFTLSALALTAALAGCGAAPVSTPMSISSMGCGSPYLAVPAGIPNRCAPQAQSPSGS